jgi:hypothetical protein
MTSAFHYVGPRRQLARVPSPWEIRLGGPHGAPRTAYRLTVGIDNLVFHIFNYSGSDGAPMRYQ